MLLLTHQARTGWTALKQAAEEMREVSLTATAHEGAGEVDRQVDWLCTHIKVIAQQALSVPVDLAAEVADSAPAPARKMLSGVVLAACIGVALGLIAANRRARA